MSNRLRAIFLFLTVTAVLLVSAVGTTNVYADDGTPPPPPTEETGGVNPSTGEGEPVATTEPTEAVPTEEPVVTEPTEAVPTEEPVVTEPTTEAAPPVEEAPVVEEQPPAETEAVSILEQVPDDTTVTVLNEEGEAQPLTSQESAEAILTGDPIWCPAFQSATPGANGCTPSFPSFNDLLTYLSGNATYQGAGTIYVQQGAYTGGESSIDFNSPTYDLSYINNYNLTVQGGWDMVDNSTDPADTTQFNIPIAIGTSTNPWVGSLTFNNISISQVYNQTGLTLFSEGDITLNNVSVTDSLAGADLNAGGIVGIDSSKFDRNKKFGANVNAAGAVYISNSEFNNNAVSKDAYDGFGLQVNSQDEVFLDTINASYNEKFGADINAIGPVTVVRSVFSGNISYTHNCSGTKSSYCHECTETANGGYGLKIVTTDGAYLYGVTANDNYLFGAHVEAIEVEISNHSGTQQFGNNFFDHNGSGSLSNPTGYGLEVVSTGGVSLEGVEANNNQLFGANIKAAGDVYVVSSFFNGNKSYYNSCTTARASCHECKETYYGYGIQVVTTGDVTMKDVTATGNHLFGAHLEGVDIAILNGVFSNNSSGSSTTLTGKGLEVVSTGEVALSNVEANNNQLFGANIQAVGNVAVSTSFFNGQKVYTSSCQGKKLTGGGYGLQIVTTGVASLIALDTVEAKDNYLYGAKLDGANIAISNSSFNDNNQKGLIVKSSGPVALNGVKANNNKLFGATIEATGDVAILNSFFNGNQSYKCSCSGKEYFGTGLKVITTGSIVLTNVIADGNYVLGAHLEGTNVTVSSSSFSKNGTGVLSDHVGKGLEIVSTGTDSQVTLLQVTANNNQLFGANVKADGLVLVDNSFFTGNHSYTYSSCKGKTYDGYGILVVTTADIRMNNVTANENYLFGAKLSGASVSVSNSIFNSNASPIVSGKTPTGRGLEVISTGDTLLQNVNANDNQLFGANVQAGGQVNVISSVFARNKYTYSCGCQTKTGGYGLKVVATGPINLADNMGVQTQAFGNGAEGAILNGQSTVTVSNSSFNDNGASGLSVTASGNVTLNNVTATGNKVDGVDVKGVCTNIVYVNGGTFANNGKYGIKIINATYTPDGTQTFANNPSGNVFQNSSTCSSSTNNASNTSTNQSNSGSSGGDHHSQWYWQWHAHSGHHHH